MTDRELLQQALDALNHSVRAFGKICLSSAYAQDVTDECEVAVEALETAIAQPVQPAEVCVWTEEDPTYTPDTYASACGELWSFVNGKPEDNNFKFCHGCGKAVSVKESE